MKLHRDHITLDIIRLKHVIILNLIHILAVTGQDLPQEIEILKPAVMMNLLGRDLDLLEDNLEIILNGMSTSMENRTKIG